MAECGLLNLPSCLPQKFFEYIEGFLNAPLQPLLDIVKDLMTAQVNLQIFSSFWAIIVYVLSMFYAILIIYSGVMLVMSGHDVVKREKAKENLRNMMIMIILIQASFFIYELVVEIGSVMTLANLSLIDDSFFVLNIDNLSNLAMQMIFYLVYILVLLLTSLILVIRYAIVASGVVLFPMSIFFYFIQPLKSYGLLILNFLGSSIFVTFIVTIFLIVFSKLVEQPIFTDIKILVMIASFLLVNCIMLFMMFFSVVKSAIQVSSKVSSLVAKFVV